MTAERLVVFRAFFEALGIAVLVAGVVAAIIAVGPGIASQIPIVLSRSGWLVVAFGGFVVARLVWERILERISSTSNDLAKAAETESELTARLSESTRREQELRIQVEQYTNELRVARARQQDLELQLAEAGANLSGADLRATDLSGVNLSGTNLTDTNLCQANLSGAKLSRANLTGANLTGADLSGADLSDADLSNTDLRGVNLRRTGLRRANLTGADLTSAVLTTEEMSGQGPGSFLDLATCYGLGEARFSESDFLPTYLAQAFRFAHKMGTRDSEIWPDFVAEALEKIKGLRALYPGATPRPLVADYGGRESEMERRALEILARIANKDVAEIEPTLDLVGDLDIDSPKALELICDIEDDLGFEVPVDAVANMETVGDLLAMVRLWVQEKSAPQTGNFVDIGPQA